VDNPGPSLTLHACILLLEEHEHEHKHADVCRHKDAHHTQSVLPALIEGKSK
jgi:hypothetical protein